MVEIVNFKSEDDYGQVIETNLENQGYPVIGLCPNDMAKRLHNDHNSTAGIKPGV